MSIVMITIAPAIVAHDKARTSRVVQTLQQQPAERRLPKNME